ncbi:hypothetical protein NOC27_1348 [Nitrosococcus oceani AFC27]|nr:hypothetical protein NOC27_1348 [Nitrosococcus oceani AFC27]
MKISGILKNTGFNRCLYDNCHYTCGRLLKLNPLSAEKKG